MLVLKKLEYIKFQFISRFGSKYKRGKKHFFFFVIPGVTLLFIVSINCFNESLLVFFRKINNGKENEGQSKDSCLGKGFQNTQEQKHMSPLSSSAKDKPQNTAPNTQKHDHWTKVSQGTPKHETVNSTSEAHIEDVMEHDHSVASESVVDIHSEETHVFENVDCPNENNVFTNPLLPENDISNRASPLGNEKNILTSSSATASMDFPEKHCEDTSEQENNVVLSEPESQSKMGNHSQKQANFEAAEALGGDMEFEDQITKDYMDVTELPSPPEKSFPEVAQEPYDEENENNEIDVQPASDGTMNDYSQEKVNENTKSNDKTISSCPGATSDHCDTLTSGKNTSQSLPGKSRNLTSSVSHADLWQGKTFQSYIEVLNLVQELEEKEFTLLSKRDSKKSKPNMIDTNIFPYERVHFICVHRHNGQKRRGKGIRRNPTLNTHCVFEFKIRLNYLKEQYELCRCNLDHVGHPVCKESMSHYARNRRLNEEERQKYIGLFSLQLKARNCNVRRVIRKELQKNPTAQDLINQTNKFRKDSIERFADKSDLEMFLEIMQGEAEKNLDNSLIVSHDDKGKVLSMFWQDSEMKSKLSQFGTILFIDGTYKLTQCGYVMITILVVDEFRKHYLVAWALVPTESKQCYKLVLDSLIKSNDKKVSDSITHIVLDKDFAEISAVNTILPHVKVVLCRYHVIKACNRHLDGLSFGKEKHVKEQIKHLFYRLVYEGTEEKYMKAWEDICMLTSNSPALDRAKTYLENSWHAIRDCFAFHVLKNCPIFSSYTNNFAENCNKQIKDKIPHRAKLEVVAKEMLNYAEEHKLRRDHEKFENAFKTYTPNEIKSPLHYELVAVGNDLLNRPLLMKLLEEFEEIDDISSNDLDFSVGQTSCPRVSGKCTFSLSNLLPCKHLFYVRRANREDILTSDMVGQRWHKTSQTLSNDKLSLVDRGQKRGKGSGHTKIHSKKRKLNPTPTKTTPIAQKTEEVYQLQAKEITRVLEKAHIFLVWYDKDVEKLVGKNRHGVDLWLNDLHMDTVSQLLKRQFPTLQGLESIITSMHFGIEPIDFNQDFIQILTSGGDHWVMITNIGVDSSRRDREVILYDSMILFDRGSQTTVTPSPSVTKGACQLIAADENQSSSTITFSIRSCEQQKNGTDCGLFAIGNSILVAHGLMPERTKYVGNLREEFLEMVKRGEAVPFQNVQLSAADQHCHLGTRSNITQTMHLPKEIKFTTARICHCKMPESFDNIVICQNCSFRYHHRCYLMGEGVAKQESNFICYACRVSGDYSFYNNPLPVDVEKIEHCASYLREKMSRITHTMISMSKKVFRVKPTPVLPSTREQFQNIKNIICQYDVTQTAHKKGLLYESFRDVFINAEACGRMKKIYLLQMNTAQLVHFAIIAIAFINRENCDPLVKSIAKGNDAEAAKQTVASESKWFKTVKSHLEQTKRTMERFCDKKLSYVDSRDQYSELKNSFCDIKETLQKSMNRITHFNSDIPQKITDSAQALIREMVSLSYEADTYLLKLRIHQGNQSTNTE